jgi:hypothetical protein
VNIFVTSHDPKEAAMSLDDKRLRKMLIETAQILSVAAVRNGYSNMPYKVTHANHPCCIWAAESGANFKWLVSYFLELSCEYLTRFSKIHKSSTHVSSFLDLNIKGDTMTPFKNCTTNTEKGISFKHISDTTQAYRMYLDARWKTDKLKPKWTNRKKPSWSTYEEVLKK